MTERITLEQCGEKGVLRSLAGGRYFIEYHDATHLAAGKWLRLAAVDVQQETIPLGEDGTEQFFTIKKEIEQLPNDPGETGNKAPDQKETDKRQRTIDDTLALALGRAGLLAPELNEELFADLMRLGAEDGVVIVPDTNALYNGAVHWLLRVLRRPSVWLLPLAASLTTVQARDATVKGLLSKTKASNVKQALRSRGLVNGALGLLQRNRGRSQVVEIAPSLLRYQKTASSSGADPDQSDILEDRLIIEAIHGVLRTMRSRTARRVVTSDVNLARVLLAEGIDTLFVPTIIMGAYPVDCLRYDALARGFIGAPLRAVLWELAHAFGSVRLTSPAGVEATLECYWAGKSPREWEAEVLQCDWTRANRKPPLAGRPDDGDDQTAGSIDTSVPTTDALQSARASGTAAVGESPESDSAATEAKVSGSRAKGASPEPRKAHRERKLPVTERSASTPLPRASLPQALRILSIVRSMDGATAAEVAAKLGDQTTSDTVRRAANLLVSLRLLTASEKQFRATDDANLIDKMLSSGDLDAFSSILEQFAPYAAFKAELRARQAIARRDFSQVVRSHFPAAGSYEAERLPRYLILSGQAWTDGELVRDGSMRLTDRDATELFQEAYSKTAVEGLAKVIALLPQFCRMGGISPWAAKRQIERLIGERLLPQYRFEPSAGGKPVTRDEVLVGSLSSVTAEPVPIDRLHLGERPVFTVGGPSL